MIVKLLTEHHLEFLSLKGGCRGSSESTHVKMPHCWESHATAQIVVTGSISMRRFKCQHPQHLFLLKKKKKKKLETRLI